MHRSLDSSKAILRAFDLVRGDIARLCWLLVLISLLLPTTEAWSRQVEKPEYVSPQEIDGTQSGSGQARSTGSQQMSLGLGDGSVKPASVFDQLIREMDNMIPGKLDENPQRKKMVEDAIKAFQNRNAEKTVEIFDQLNASNSQLPPTDLLLASLSFIINDQKTGKVLLERAASKYPENPGVSSAFSRLAINEGRIADGAVHLEKLERLLADPEVASDIRDFYAKQYLDGMVDVAMSQKRYPDARAMLDQQRERLPESPKVQMVSAELEFWEKNIDKSLEYLQGLRAKNPRTRAPESIIASWYRRIGDQANFEKWLGDAVQKYPEDPQVQLEYASWAIGKEDFELATESINKAVANSKETFFSHNLKAKIAFAKGSYVTAAFHYETMASASPNNIDALNMLALSLVESVDEKKRQRALELALNNFRRAPDNLVTRSALGYIQLRLGNLEQAKGALSVGANTKRGASPEIDYFVASVLKAMDKKENARRVLDIAIGHKGFFLYRGPAKKMLNDLGGPLPSKTSEQNTSEPKKSEPKKFGPKTDNSKSP